MIKTTFSQFLTIEQLERLEEVESNDGKILLTVDVHGMHSKETKTYLNNLINASRRSFLMKVIHGYNHGTALKEMLTYNFENKHIGNKYSDSNNYGVTYIQIVA